MINAFSVSQPEHNEKFCRKCGERTVAACQECRAPIRGYYHIPNVYGGGPETAPSYCHNCGKAYPWTESALKAARDLSDDLQELTDEEREKLKGTLDELVKDSPQTTVAAGRFNRLLQKAVKSAAEAFRQILVDVISESAKKIIFPQG
jgi:hypothetical protein